MLAGSNWLGASIGEGMWVDDKQAAVGGVCVVR